ncbi:MAG: hypothetical protein IJ189_03655 [Clostridia bacterium]|nr:hypothetical protein [Clostridia bacterium]
MKKIFALVLAAMMLLSATAAFAEDTPAPIKLGQVDYAAHGAQYFAVITAAVQGDTILAAYIDEFQVMQGDAVVGVPNSDAAFGANIVGNEDGKVLGSKKVNNDYYSANMATKGDSTVALINNYEAIEAYVAGKTIAELEAAVDGVDAAAFVDAVSGATLADTLNYVKGIIAAAKAANNQVGKYTLYNKTGETVTEIYLTDNVTGEKSANLAGAGLAADGRLFVSKTLPGSEDGEHRLTLSFVTESGLEGAFTTLSIETAFINLLDADAMSSATNNNAIKFVFQ